MAEHKLLLMDKNGLPYCRVKLDFIASHVIEWGHKYFICTNKFYNDEQIYSEIDSPYCLIDGKPGVIYVRP